MFTVVEHASVSFLVPPLRICVCVWTGTFGHMSSAIDSRYWRDPLFSSARDPIIIPGWSYINSDATWRMRTVHHTSESEEREPSTRHRLPTTAESTAMKMSSTTVLSVAVLRLRRVASVVMTLTSEG